MAAWTPTDATTALWLDASDSEAMTLDGSVISQLDDKSGNDRHATGSGSARPTLVTNAINGLSIAQFSGNQTMSVARPFSGAGSVWHVQKTTGTGRYILLSSGGSYIGLTVANGSSDPIDLNFGSPDWYRDGTLTGWTTRANAYDGLYNRAAVVGASDCSMASWGTPIVISGYSSYLLSGDIGEMIAIDGTVSAALREKIEGYLAWKWGLEANLPSGHPYEDAAPEGDKYGFAGTILDSNGDPAARTVRIYLASTGALVDTVTSSAVDGAWSYETNSEAAHTIVATGESGRNDLIASGVTKAVIESAPE